MSDVGRRAIRVLALLGLLTFTIGASKCPPVIEKGVLHTAKRAVSDPELAIGGSAAFVAWIEPPGLYVSKANALSNPHFNPPVAVDNDSDSQFSIQANSSRVYLAWRSALGRSIRFSTSPAAEVSFAPAKALTSGADARASHPQVAAFGTGVVVAWLQGLTPSTSALNVVFSRNSGDSFEPVTTLSTTANTSPPAMAAVGGTVYLVWCDGTVLTMKRSTNNGENWGTAEALTGSQSGCRDPVIRVAGTDVHVAWTDSHSSAEPSEVFIRSSTNNGVAFGQTFNLSQTSGARSDNPSLSVVGQNVYVGWRDQGADAGKDDDILFVRSDNRGAAFSNWVLLSPGDFDKASNAPVVRASGSNVRVVWQDAGMDNYDIFSRLSGNNGQDFSVRASLSTPGDTRGEGRPRMYAYGNQSANRLIVWTRGDPVKSVWEILYDSWFKKE